MWISAKDLNLLSLIFSYLLIRVTHGKLKEIGLTDSYVVLASPTAESIAIALITDRLRPIMASPVKSSRNCLIRPLRCLQMHPNKKLC